MIQVRKTGRREIHVLFDAAGAKDLESALGGQRAVTVLADGRILKRRGVHADTLHNATFMVVTDETKDALLVESDRMTLYLDAESAETIAARLQKVESTGFFPAEMIDVEFGGLGGEAMTLYGEFVAEDSGSK